MHSVYPNEREAADHRAGDLPLRENLLHLGTGLALADLAEEEECTRATSSPWTLRLSATLADNQAVLRRMLLQAMDQIPFDSHGAP